MNKFIVLALLLASCAQIEPSVQTPISSSNVSVPHDPSINDPSVAAYDKKFFYIRTAKSDYVAFEPNLIKAQDQQGPIFIGCLFEDDMPTWVPDCQPECYHGIGYKLDLDCVTDAQTAWKKCQKAACKTYFEDFAKAQNARNEVFDAAISTALHCMANATNQAEIDECAETARQAIDVADAALAARAQVLAFEYTGAVLQCDYTYLANVEACCAKCDPWDGWEEDN